MRAQVVDTQWTPNLAYLVEAIKVEGNWSPNYSQVNIQNKDLAFLQELERITKAIGLNLHKRILLKAKIPKDANREDVSLKINGITMNSHIQVSPFDGSKMIVCNFSKPAKEIMLEVKGQKCGIKLTNVRNQLIIEARVPTYAYQSISFTSIQFNRFLVRHIKRKKPLRVENRLKASSTRHILAAFSALIDAEGSLDYHGFRRSIRIRMHAHQYLEDWKLMLQQIGVQSKVRKNSGKEYELNISGYEDFSKLHHQGLQLHHSKKSKKWAIILNSYLRKQVSRCTAEEHYMTLLISKGKPITARELATAAKKDRRTINHYLKILMDKKQVEVIRKGNLWLYVLSTT